MAFMFIFVEGIPWSVFNAVCRHEDAGNPSSYMFEIQEIKSFERLRDQGVRFGLVAAFIAESSQTGTEREPLRWRLRRYEQSAKALFEQVTVQYEFYDPSIDKWFLIHAYPSIRRRHFFRCAA